MFLPMPGEELAAEFSAGNQLDEITAGFAHVQPDGSPDHRVAELVFFPIFDQQFTADQFLKTVNGLKFW